MHHLYKKISLICRFSSKCF